jgi:hypothetical protein
MQINPSKKQLQRYDVGDDSIIALVTEEYTFRLCLFISNITTSNSYINWKILC